MEELSIEEKARRYDEAIKVAKSNYETFVQMDENCLFAKEGIVNTFHHIFPELKESEDEKIRQFLIHEVTGTSDKIMSYRNMNKKDVIAWLENQGEDNKKGYSVWVGGFEINDYNLSKEEAEKLAEEYKKNGYNDVIVEKQSGQKPTDKVEPKFHKGDWVVVNDDDRIGRIIKCTKERADVDLEFGVLSTEINNIRSWTIQDAKDGDVLVSSSGKPFIFKGFFDNDPMAYGGLVADDSFWIALNSNWTTVYCKPATKEQRELLFQKIKEAGYEWNAEKKELKKIEQNTAWSKDDETALNDALWCCEQAACIARDENDMGNIWCAENWLKSLKDRVQPLKQELSDWDKTIIESIEALCDEKIESVVFQDVKEHAKEIKEWLKSIKDRYTWKPSDEQMKALLSKLPVVKGGGDKVQDILESLYQDLKKLKGQSYDSRVLYSNR